MGSLYISEPTGFRTTNGQGVAEQEPMAIAADKQDLVQCASSFPEDLSHKREDSTMITQTIIRRFSLRILATFILALMLVASSWGQETTQGIRGTVQDQSGAVIPGAKITVTSLDTGEVRTTTTEPDGTYAILRLPLGRYSVMVEAAGFQRTTVTGLTLQVGQLAEVNISLQVGALTQQVEVSVEPPMIQTSSSSLAVRVNSVQMENLPLNTRSFTSFTTIQPGISQFYGSADTANATAAQQGQGSKISAQGQRPGFVAYLQDGMDITDGSSAGVPGTGGGDMLGVEGIAEFQVQTHNYSAEFGQSAGAVISYVTKSGTNEFHGSAYEYIRNDTFDARNFFDPAEVPPFKRNQFGASAGGPLVRGKTFIFGNYEGLRQRLTRTGIFFVPSQAVQAAAAGSGVISDPALISAIGLDQPDPFGLPLPGYDAITNTFTIAPAVRPYVLLYPVPQLDIGSGVGQLAAPDKRPIVQDYFIAKVDHHFSEDDTFSVRYSFMENDNSFTANSPVFDFLNDNRLQNITLREVHLFSPSLINTMQFGFNRSKVLVTLGENVPIDSSLYITPERGSFGVIEISGTTGGLTAGGGGLARLGGDQNLNLELFNNIFQIADDVSWIRGNHTVKFGGLVKRFQLNDHGKPSFGFGGYTFFSLAAFLAADPQILQIQADGANVARGRRQTFFAWYIQDDYRITPRLTLNLGIRHEFHTMISEVDGQLSNLPDSNGTQLLIGKLFDDNYTLKQFQPRAGFAYDIFGNSKTVLRAGAGMFHNYIPIQNIRTESDVNPPFSTSNVWVEAVAPTPVSCGGPSPGLYLAFPNCPEGQQFPAAVAANPANGSFLLNYGGPINSPLVYQWNLGLDTAILSDLKFGVGYVGSHTIHLPILTEDSVVASTRLSDGRLCFIAPDSPLCPGASTPLLTNRPFAVVFHTPYVGNSDYNALVVELEKRFSHGFQFGANYVWSHTRDISDDEFAGNVQVVSSPTTNQFDIDSDWGNAAFDIRHRFIANFVAELPFGAGRAIGGGATGAANKVLSGWSVSSIITAQSGSPFTPQSGQNFSRSGNVLPWDRPSFNPAFSGNVITGTPEQWFNPAAFIPATIGTQGNVGRGTFTTDGLVNFDLSISKMTHINEQVKIDFTTQFFNLLNQTNFSFPSLNLFDPNGSLIPSAGRVTSTTTNSRQIQFGLKLSW